jgi:formylmethanofuran dehydrogenase subunit E
MDLKPIEMEQLREYLAASSAKHSHLCPRQVLGVRLALAGVGALGLVLPRTDKRLLAIVESDGCFSDGVAVVTGCSVGHRTLRVEDYGMVAATFVDTLTEYAVRVSPQIDVRQRASAYARGEDRIYFAQLSGYQIMPDDELVDIRPVHLHPSVKTLLSLPGIRAICERCGEEITNERQVIRDGQVLCRVCAGPAYFSYTPPNSYR